MNGIILKMAYILCLVGAVGIYLDLDVHGKPKPEPERTHKIIKIRNCDYVVWYKSQVTQLLHAGDCPNTIHKGRR